MAHHDHMRHLRHGMSRLGKETCRGVGEHGKRCPERFFLTPLRSLARDEERVLRRAGPERAAALNELSARIDESLAALPVHFRAAFALVVDRGLSHAEAARALGCSENTVAWRMHKARKLLRARMKPFLEEVRS